MTTSVPDRSRLFEGALGIPAIGGNRIEILRDGV